MTENNFNKVMRGREPANPDPSRCDDDHRSEVEVGLDLGQAAEKQLCLCLRSVRSASQSQHARTGMASTLSWGNSETISSSAIPSATMPTTVATGMWVRRTHDVHAVEHGHNCKRVMSSPGTRLTMLGPSVTKT